MKKHGWTAWNKPEAFVLTVFRGVVAGAPGLALETAPALGLNSEYVHWLTVRQQYRLVRQVSVAAVVAWDGGEVVDVARVEVLGCGMAQGRVPRTEPVRYWHR